MNKRAQSTYVTHDGYRWRVTELGTLDGRPAYDLERNVIFRSNDDLKTPRVRRITLVAFTDDCPPWAPAVNGRRILRDGRHVLEFIPREGKQALVSLRLAKSSKRWETSLDAIYSMTVEKAKKRAGRRRR